MKKVCLVVLFGVMLSSCEEYPSHQHGEAVRLTSKPNWGGLMDKEIAIGGDCHVDSINDEPGEGLISHTVQQSGAVLKVSGWGAISVKEGVVASEIALALKSNSAQGTRLFATVTKGKRPDVADYFKNPASVDTGFSTAIDLSDVLPGNYVLEVIQHKDGKNLKCQHTATIIVEN